MTVSSLRRVNFRPYKEKLHLIHNWACFEHYFKIINFFEKWILENGLRKFKNGIQILVGPVGLELLIESCKI